MDLIKGSLRDVWDQGRRATVEALSGRQIDNDAPFSPNVPDELREWLPDLFDRFPVTLPWDKPIPIDPAIHSVWLLDNTAFRIPRSGDDRPELAELRDANASPTDPASGNNLSGKDSGWEAEFVACYFVKNSGRDLARVEAALIRRLNIRDDDLASRKRIAQRLQPFVDMVLPRRTVRVSIGGAEEQTLGPSSANGISSALHALHVAPAIGARLTTSAVDLPPPFGLTSTTTVADERGWLVVSDIDDTIKITGSTDPFGILANTFTTPEFQPVAGMPELYAQMQASLDLPPFFYLSASPYNLYPMLREFRTAHYPHGPLILRDASWQNLGGLIASLQHGTQDYKQDRMRKIHSWFPHRRLVCLGDSTQSDPEAYGEMARRYPGWIAAIFIRKVSGIAFMDVARKNAPERFEKAFEGLDRRLWYVFTNPSEVAERIDDLARRENPLETAR